MIQGLTVILLGLLLALPAKAALTIGDAVSIALQKNPTVLQAREKIPEGKANTSYAWAQFLPNIGFSTNVNYQKDALNLANPLFNGLPYNYYSFNFTATQPLYRGGAVSAGLGYAKKDEQLRNFNLQITERNLQVQVIDAFYTILLNQRHVTQYERDQASLKKLLKEAYRRLKIGRSDKIEILQEETQLALVIPELITAKNQVDISVATLALLLEDHESGKLEIEGSLEPPNWKKYMEQITNVSPYLPDLEQLPVAEAQLKDTHNVTMAAFWPTVNAVGTWGRAAYVESDLLDDYANEWTLGIQVSIPIFSGLSSVFERRSFTSNETELMQTNQATRDTLYTAQVTAKKNLDTALEVIEPNKYALDIAIKTVEQATKEYTLGITDYLTYYNTFTALDQAQFTYDQSLYNLIAAEVQYIAATGYPMDTYLKILGEPR